MLENIVAHINKGSASKDIQTAIDTAYETGIGTVIIPSGEYILDKTVEIPEYTHVIIDGARLILDENSKDESVFINSHANKSYGFAPGFIQQGVSITGKNGAYIKGKLPVLIRNGKNFLIEDLTIESTNDFAIFVILSLNGKIRNVKFENCYKGIGFGPTVRDCFINDIHGEVKDSAFDFDNSLRSELGFSAPRDFDIMNHIIRDVDVRTEKTFAHFDGEGRLGKDLSNVVGRIIFTNVNVDNKNGVAFDIRSATDIVLQNVSSSGKLVNDDLTKRQVYIS